jgi:ParB family chromosome partitioning protein
MNSKQRKFEDLIKEHQVNNKEDKEMIEEIEINEIIPNPDQPRKIFDDEKIENLALSIKQNGLFQPIILKRVKNKYMIIAGERRFKAFQQLNLKKIPAVVRQYQNNKIQEIALIENIQREDLNPIEEAKAYQYILDNGTYKNHELALKVGKSRSHVVNMLGLLRLPEEVIEMVEKNQLSMGHARAISKIRSEVEMKKIAKKSINEKFSVRKLEDYINEKNKKTKSTQKTNRKTELESRLNELFEVKSKIEDGSISIKGEANSILKIVEKLLKN